MNHELMKKLTKQYGLPTIMVIEKGQSYTRLCAELARQATKEKIMAYLWCNDCGEEKKNKFDNATMEDGESVVLTEGPLTTGNYICDKCNKDIVIGDMATLCEFLPSGYQYSTGLSMTYFNIENTNKKTYS